MPGGRPTKLTPEVQERIVESLRAGNYLEAAAEMAGVSKQTVYRWMDQGEHGEGPFREFYNAVKRARAEAENFHVANVKRAAADNWQASAWWLERSFPDRWGRKDRLEHTGAGGSALRIVIGGQQSE